MNPGSLPTDSLALAYMPSQLVGLITPEHFMYCSSFAGLFSAVIIWVVFSRGL